MNEALVDRLVAGMKLRSDGCWIWMKGKDKDGYGLERMPGTRLTRRAHRMSWEVRNGAIPAGLMVLHRCDEPSCINPGHMFLGTALDNAKDRDQKGRGGWASGEDHGQAKLTKADVSAIRALMAAKASREEVARRFGVSETSIHNVIHGLTWKDKGRS